MINKIVKVIVLAVIVLPGCGEQEKPTRDSPNILLLVNDAWRKDSVGAYGAGSELTPRIDELARRSVLFETPVSQSSCTINSAPSMLFGVYPTEHHYFDYQDRVSSRLVSVAEMLKRGGYETFALSTNPHVSETNGLAQGFDTFEAPSGWGKVGCAQVNEQFTTWLAREKPVRFFAMLWYTDTHVPYDPPLEYQRRFVPEHLWSKIDEVTMMPGGEDLDPEQRVVARALYDAAVNYFDDETGKLLDHLERAGLLDSTVVVLTSDHGEAFWENSSPVGKSLYGHGSTLYGAQIDVPMIVSLPDCAAKRVSTIVQHIDLLPTLTDLANVPCETGYPRRGKSLVPMMRAGDQEASRTVFVELSLEEYGPYLMRGARTSSSGITRSHIVDGRVMEPSMVEEVSYGPGGADLCDEGRASLLEGMDRWTGALMTDRFPAEKASLFGDEKDQMEEQLRNLGYLR